MYVIKKAQLIAKAEEQMAQHPQYKGRFDKMIMVQIKKDQERTLGTAFSKGEISLADAEFRESKNVHTGKIGLYMTVWSFSNECMTSVAFKDIKVLGGLEAKVA